MAKVELPYGKEKVVLEVPDDRLQSVLVSELHHYTPEGSQIELVRKAIENPIGSDRLSSMAKDKDKIVIISSDHTRPVPSKIIMPLMLEEIRRGNPEADITILISTGCHRETTRNELIEKFGNEIVSNEKIYIHDCDDESMFVKLGILPSGGELIINKLATEADLLVAEGFIEPHFFAGYSGGRKSVLPGIASRLTVLANHSSEFIADPNSRTGILEGNPIHKDMIWAAKTARLAYIVNVIINDKKEVIYAVAGDAIEAHEKGCEFLSGLCKVKAVSADIVVSTNGGYPLDQNIYQAVKGMTAAEVTVKQDGVIIMLAKSSDGHGGDVFYKTFKEADDIKKVLDTFVSRGRNETEADQWQSQVFIRVLQKAKIIYVSDADDETIKDFHMIPAKNVKDALKKAEEILGNDNATVTVIPDGVSVMVVE
ncbi:nickel-dependent lactate racemase [Sedimentibacter sp. MB31-C6]|uniref:nickel-dependent lactate racemase n=1 Tax=Sedimentibacter sp. MB31-C6 TaxID=3109366 RepID=UPI002DDCE3B5|nr:nickel-dependent lactate racemase [Sedimentibacter sp. MB36-C1]WSI02914.1 nickel-dependent lactate racemase [Sedimentibacter sp. MB36-C1]